MSIEKKFRTYLAVFDGTKKSFSDIGHLFEEIYDKDFEVVQDGHVIDREKVKQIQAKGFELGSTATLLHFSTHSVDGSSFNDLEESTIEFKLRFTNDEWDIVDHNIVTVRGNKFIRAKPIEDAKPILFVNFQAYMNSFDGTPKDFSSVCDLFKALYHDDFVYQLDGKFINQHEMKRLHASIFALGSKATCLLFKSVGSDQVEFKFQMVNDKMNVIIHNIAAVEDNKLIRSKPIDQATLESVVKAHGAIAWYEAVNNSASTPGMKPVSEIESGNPVVVAPQ